MKKFLKNIALFLLLFFLVDKLFYWKIQSLPERELDKRLELIMDGKMNKDILIFGSSRAQHNLYSDAIQNSLKMPTFNLGYRGCTIDFQLFLLKSVLNHNKKPKVIFLTVDDDREFLPEKTLQFRYDKLYPLVKFQEITNELICRKDISPFAVVFYSARLGWEQFKKSKSVTKYENWTPAGTVLLDFQISNFDKVNLKNNYYDIKFELPERLASFKEFQQICIEEKIKLYIVVPPNFSNQNKKFVNRIKNLIIDKKIILYADNRVSFDKEKCFFDQSHLNKTGAILYTNTIITKVKSELSTKSMNR
jgi:hypothetical protein